MQNFKIIELTKDCEDEYLKQVVNLENEVYKNMEINGRRGQLFPTGEEGIRDYIESKENTVMVAVDKDKTIQSATYITQGQIPFTYNDITKYFKYGDEYQEYVKKSYSNNQEYQKDMLDTYKIKIDAFRYAKNKIFQQFPEYSGNIMEFLKHEIDEEGNHFHEKSQLRELFNIYMSQYISEKSKNNPNLQRLYERFYWTTSKEISKEFKKDASIKDTDTQECENLINLGKDEIEYTNILQKGPLEIHEKPTFDESKYFNANTGNSIELDTYLTSPGCRHAGLARVIVYEGIKKHIERHFTDTKNSEIFLCSTLHRDNLSSKYVSEFFGLTDNLYVKRRDGRDREVHIRKVPRERYKEYLTSMQKKLAILYKYNPENIKIDEKDEKQILQDQLEYERKEYERLRLNEQNGNKLYTGAIRYRQNKHEKVKQLTSRLNKINSKERSER